MQFQPILDAIVEEMQPHLGAGTVASYIPALARVPADQFGIALCSVDGQLAAAGSANTPFSIQSISKVFTLTLAMQLVGDWLWQRIGREPSGDPFNSLVQLEHEQGVPRNPLINAGAIAVADRLVSACPDAKAEILAMMSDLCGEPVHFDEEVAESEASTGFRNYALANFMKSFGKLDNLVPSVLDVYFHQCALSMTCVQLARAASYLCADGRHPNSARAPEGALRHSARAPEGALRPSGRHVISERQARRVNALMLTCGTYDAAGEFAFRIGLPCKSGVGGGIIAVVPDKLSLCVWSPGLDRSGNSLVGMRALEAFVEKTDLSVF